MNFAFSALSPQGDQKKPASLRAKVPCYFFICERFSGGETPEDRLRETGLRFCGQTVKKVKIQAAATLIAEAGRARAVSIALGFVIH
ncbi:hypothetical protein C4B62_10960 [Serratia marcescens]|nr:hypothetical protein C4B62_10960 [Serratia marcescens]